MRNRGARAAGLNGIIRIQHGVIVMKSALLFGLMLLAICLLPACDKPRLTGVDPEKIDTSVDPEQIPVTSEDSMVITVKNGSFGLTPKAEYTLSGMVVGRESYSDGWESTVSPVDLAIVWGKLAEPHHDKYVSYRQDGRWYFFKMRANSPFDTTYVTTHSGNNHIIPANQNVSKAVRSIRREDLVVLKGFLVNLKGIYKGKHVFWNTSLSRSDTGSGSCELLYVTRVRIDSRVYE